MRRPSRFVIRGTLPLLLATPAAYGTDIFGTQPGALDQPQVHVQFRRPSDPSAIVNFDPADQTNYIANAILDTGASSHLLSNLTAGVDVNNPGFGILRAVDGGGNQVIFNDVGGGGEVQLNVSEELIAQIASRTLFTSFTIGGDPDFRPEPSDFGPNLPTQRWQVGPANQPIPEDPLGLLLDPLAGINVVGMPAMLNKVVVMDSRGVNNLALDPFNFENVAVLNTFIYDDANVPFDPVDAADPQTSVNPGVPATNRHIKLSYADFSSYVSTDPPAGPAPAIAHNPFIGKDPVRTARGIPQEDVPDVKVFYDGKETQGSFLLDTGAGASFISTDLAGALGVKYRTDRLPGDPLDGADPLLVDANDNEIAGQFKITLSAFGADDPADPDDSSSITISGFYVDDLLVRTMEGDPNNLEDAAHLNYYLAPVLVFDINVTDPVTGLPYSLDGIFGMNFLTASADPPETLEELLALAPTPGAFDWIVYDEAAGTLGLSIVPEPGGAALISVLTLPLVRRRRRRPEAHRSFAR